VNVGGSRRDAKVSSPPMPAVSVGGVIVLGGRESRLQGEGRQEIDVGWTIRHRSPRESLVSPEILAAVTKEEPMTALAESRQSLESPLQGNLHGGFGGGCAKQTRRDPVE
jgi:hypothetical protein